MLGEIYQRIVERLEAMGLQPQEASLRAGLNKDAIRNIKRAVSQPANDDSGGRHGERVGISTHTLVALASVLGTTASWLLEGDDDDPGSEDGLPVIDWERLAAFVDPAKSFKGVERFGPLGGRWPGGHFVTRVSDNAMDRLCPAGSYIVIDRGERTLIDGRCYVGIVDDRLIFRRYYGDPDRAEPCSIDPAFRTQFLAKRSHWKIIGRVKRALVDL